MGLFGKKKQPEERNAIDDQNLKIQLLNAALGTLVEGEEYGDLENTKAEFGYLFEIEDHGVEALFKLITDKGTFYYAFQVNKLMRLNFTEELFQGTTESFLEMHGGE